jgi:hypothetical protein
MITVLRATAPWTLRYCQWMPEWESLRRRTPHLVNKELSLHCVALELKNPSHMIFGGVEGHVRITLSLPLKLSGIVTFFTPNKLPHSSTI